MPAMTKRDDSEDKGKGVSTEESEDELRKKAAEREEEDDDDEEEEEDDEEEEDKPAPAKGEPKGQAAAAAKRQAERRSKRAEPARAQSSASVAVPRAMMFAVFALAVGGAGGWFGHDAQAKAHLKAESAAAPAGSGSATGACGAWQSKICKTGGDTSAVCAQAKGAIELLTPSSCEAALSVMPATLAKVKALRASCDSLVSKLCKDLPQGSQACTLVKDKTPAFPSQRCDEMLKHYDEVLASLREIDQQGPMGGPQMGGPGGPGGPGGMRPQMGAPGMRPQMNPPPGH